MTGSWRALAAAIVVCAPGVAAADGLAVGGWLGPRFYSDDSKLGYIENAPQHPALGNGMMIGFRIGYPVTSWLVPELELPFAVSSTDILDTTVFWFEPRGHLRFEFLPRNPYVRPFLLLGGGSPISLSSKNKIFANDITGEGYFGIGAHALTGRGFQIRADFRVAITPGIEKTAVIEFEAGLGLWVSLGGSRKSDRPRDPTGPERDNPVDPDRDGIAGAGDNCPDRAEDDDGFEDTDGCPDIDNDLDHVLDIADKCASVPESFNGFEDDDGCPDIVPADLDAIDGTIEGLTYAPGETALTASGRKQLKQVGEVLTKYPTVKLVVIGYADDREALPTGKPAPAPERGDGTDGEAAEPDPAQLAVELSVERAAVIKAMLVGMGIREGRIDVAGKGAEDPVGDNETKRGRQANRRVVLKRFVPPAIEQ